MPDAPSPLPVRPATVADAPAIAAVHVASWRSAYAGLMPAAYLDAVSVEAETARWTSSLPRDPNRNRHTLVTGDAAGLTGYATAGPDPADPERGLLFLMYVLPGHWGQGAGPALMRAAMQTFASLGFNEAVLWVLEDNLRARRFYERHGWQPDGARTIDNYGGQPLAALRYTTRA